ncbi:hypothetical protein TTHERM_00122310 (macronuclear) [Tetrahymena thermophila SB210]|uniref:Uncharacterized protein n=1 Tax=Tetrahymena thermophila (strain SB210) TaxID=312017 RepID=Q22YT9_TETTS|nr:hypothetical protein TTHERM_00122310 [Tetrahymena thermophila SB210]EAR90582.2 hypothetical protein TTHERM_00122310 [Tetrahymena thermophila SB210]|eukprot:XP_001010827.2 hypothetical protein TTHERM_00122310 [Tetrahymena thermophila SB210]
MSENKFQHDGIYALHVIQNQQKQINMQNQHQRKSSVTSTVVGQHNQSVSSQLNQNGMNKVQLQNQQKENQQNSRHQTSQSYADFIAEKANEYRQHKNSRFEQKMQPQPPQLSQRSPKGSNLSVWATEKENRFDWIGKEQKKYFQEINGQLKSYKEIQVNQSTQGSWQNLIDKTPITEQYQKKRSLSRDANTKQNTLRVLHPEQQETPRFNPCFKGVVMQEQINPLKLEERARENKIQKKHQNNLQSYEKIVNKGVIPDTTGREIAISRRKSTDIKMKYDYSTRVVLKTEEGVPIKYSPSKIRQMYEDAYNNNMSSVIFQTDISHSNESFVLPQKITQSKFIQSVSTLNNYETPNAVINPQINNFLEQKSVINNQSNILKDSQRISKPPLTQNTIVEKNSNNNKLSIQQQHFQKSQNNKDVQQNSQPSNKNKGNTSQQTQNNTSSIHCRKSSQGQLLKQEYSTQNNEQTNVKKNQMELHNIPQDKTPEQIKKNYYNVDYKFNQNRQRSNSKRRSSQTDVLRAGDRLWTDVRDQNQEELNKDPSRERLKTNTSDRYNFQGNQEFWQSQKQEQLWKQEMKLKEKQNNNIILDDRKKINRRTQSLSTNLLTENSTNLNDLIITENQQQNNQKENQLNQSQKIQNPYNNIVKPQQSQIPFQIQPQIDRRNSINNPNNSNNQRFNTVENTTLAAQNSLRNSPYRTRQNSQSYNNNDYNCIQYQTFTQENSKNNTPRQYDYSPQQRVQTKSIETSNKQYDRDQTPKHFYNIEFNQAKAIKQKMQRSQIQF